MDRGKLIALLMAMTPEGAEGDSCDVFLRIPIRHIRSPRQELGWQFLGRQWEGLEAQIKWCGALTDWSF